MSLNSYYEWLTNEKLLVWIFRVVSKLEGASEAPLGTDDMKIDLAAKGYYYFFTLGIKDPEGFGNYYYYYKRGLLR